MSEWVSVCFYRRIKFKRKVREKEIQQENNKTNFIFNNSTKMLCILWNFWKSYKILPKKTTKNCLNILSSTNIQHFYPFYMQHPFILILYWVFQSKKYPINIKDSVKFERVDGYGMDMNDWT